MRTNTLIEIERVSIRQIYESYAAEDGVVLTDDLIGNYTESVIADATSHEWVDSKSGYVYRFNVIFDIHVDTWLDDEPMNELCPDILPDIAALMGERYEVLTVWESFFDIQTDYFGDTNHNLYLELIGEVDTNKLNLSVKDK